MRHAAPRHTAVFVPVLALTLLLVTALGAQTQPASTERERQAGEIEAMLMAPCCFSQQVSVHKSPAADDAKVDIRRRLAAGETRQHILDAYVAEHGKRVLAEPPAEGFDKALYVTPFVLLVASLGLLALIAKRITRHAPAAAAGSSNSSDDLTQRLADELRDMD